MAMLHKVLEDDRKAAGWSVCQAAWRLGVSIREYRELEDGKRSPSFETWDRTCKTFGWPQTFSEGPVLEGNLRQGAAGTRALQPRGDFFSQAQS